MSWIGSPDCFSSSFSSDKLAVEPHTVASSSPDTDLSNDWNIEESSPCSRSGDRDTHGAGGSDGDNDGARRGFIMFCRDLGGRASTFELNRAEMMQRRKRILDGEKLRPWAVAIIGTVLQLASVCSVGLKFPCSKQKQRSEEVLVEDNMIV